MQGNTAPMPFGVFVNGRFLERTTFTNSPSPIRKFGTPRASESTTHSVAAPPDPFVDHYSIMNLDMWATSEEIKEAHRKLRAEYFSTDAVKYKALMTAYSVLIDTEERWAYDREYRARMGMPPPVSLDATLSGLQQPSPSEVQDESVHVADEDVREVNGNNPNHVLATHHIRTAGYVPFLGTRPYHSYVPIAVGYEGRERHETLMCRRPRYSLRIARMSRSV
jgi:hypothetical protein